MTLLVVGINYKSAPLALREYLLFSPEQQVSIFDRLGTQIALRGGLLLSTCNRTELYFDLALLPSGESEAHGADDAIKCIVEGWCQQHQVALATLTPHLYWHQDQAAVAHLMRVASGLDSLLLGEAQILGQVKRAYWRAQYDQQLSAQLDRLFQKVFYTAKRIRTETELGAHALSIAYAVCTVIRKHIASLRSVNVLLVGAGQAIQLVAQALYKQQVKTLIIANRCRERAQRLAQTVNATVVDLSELGQQLTQADVVITATTRTMPLIDKETVERALCYRTHRPLLCIDLAVPRDIEPDVGQLSTVALYTVDDLQGVMQYNLTQRQVAAGQAEQIVQQESRHFMSWLSGQSANSAICSFRIRAEATRQQLQQQALAALKKGEAADGVVHKLAYQLTQQLIHRPTKALKLIGQQGGGAALKQLLAALELPPE